MHQSVTLRCHDAGTVLGLRTLSYAYILRMPSCGAEAEVDQTHIFKSSSISPSIISLGLILYIPYLDTYSVVKDRPGAISSRSITLVLEFCYFQLKSLTTRPFVTASSSCLERVAILASDTGYLVSFYSTKLTLSKIHTPRNPFCGLRL